MIGMNERRHRMSDLISREALKNAFKAWKTMDDYYHDTDCNDIPLSEAFDLINNAPTVVAENATSERPQGKWIPQTDYDGFTYWKCSNCGKKNDYYITDFCPNCGADMRGRMKIIICDRCKKQIEYWQLKKLKIKSYYDGSITKIDLCDNCFEDFKHFYYREDKKDE